MTAAGTVRVEAQDITVGDIIVFLGKPHRVSRIVSYEPTAFPGESWRVAHDDVEGWTIALVPGQWLDVAG